MVVKVISGDHAVAWAARLARVEVVPAFPITPQTLIMEQIAEFVNNGELDADFIPVESEHSVMSVAVGASAGGVRTFTATASQGLALMHEMLYAPPQIRLPVVMANANRSLGAAAGIWLEHNDSMPERESGWLQCYVEDNQEALDMTLQAFRIAEDHRVMLPVMICLDGFVLSHTVEKVDVPDQLAVDSFLPKFVPVNVLDPDDPVVMNPICPPEYATEMRYQLDRAIDGAKDVIKEIGIDFGKRFGRTHGDLLDLYRMEGAEYALLAIGTAATTSRLVVDRLRSEGKKVGLIRLRFMRPFPREELLKAVTGLRALGVFDRSVAFNSFGPVFTEVRSALYGSQLPITDHIAGLGGRDLAPEVLVKVFQAVEDSMDKTPERDVYWHDLRGEM
jgi:pyruvate ferredoxin oxidoreductase alpha subunit